MALNFEAFIDESYTDGFTGARTCDGEFILGGHIATAEAWAQFAGEWEKLLPCATKNKNGILRFKMAEMNSPERMKRVPQFYEVIEKHVFASISYRLNKQDFVRGYERACEAIRRLYHSDVMFAEWTNPYFFCFRSLMETFHTRRSEFAELLSIDDGVEFIFDELVEKKPILEAWDEIVDRHDDKTFGATPRFEKDETFYPLQAADLWTWWVRHWHEEDASVMPDKMRCFDFGEWRGKQRRILAISATEDTVVDTFQALAMQAIADGRFKNTPS